MPQLIRTKTKRGNDIMKGFLVVGLFAVFALACGPNERIMNSAKESESETEALNRNVAAMPKTGTLERDVQAMRDADFNFIYVFKRKDGGTLDAGDKRFVAERTPPEVNRRRVGDTEKWIILGSNFRLEPAVLDEMKQRFVFEDYSKPASELPMNGNTANN